MSDTRSRCWRVYVPQQAGYVRHYLDDLLRPRTYAVIHADGGGLLRALDQGRVDLAVIPARAALGDDAGADGLTLENLLKQAGGNGRPVVLLAPPAESWPGYRTTSGTDQDAQREVGAMGFLESVLDGIADGVVVAE